MMFHDIMKPRKPAPGNLVDASICGGVTINETLVRSLGIHSKNDLSFALPFRCARHRGGEIA